MENKVRSILKKLKRIPNANKHSFGHVLVVAGNIGFGGAGILASTAAISCGAGLVSLATRSENVTAALSYCPEVMAMPVNSGQDLDKHLFKPSVLCVGPGLGTNAWSEQVLYKSLHAAKERNVPILIDADGLNLLPKILDFKISKKNLIITPHEGEAARLLKANKISTQKNRQKITKKLFDLYPGTVVLKGKETIVYDGGSFLVCPAGNPGMAVGGMGDVLSGMISGYLAQGLSSKEASVLGVFHHAVACDSLQENYGQRSLRPSILLDHLVDLEL